MKQREGSIQRSIRVLQYCIDNPKDLRTYAVIEGILIAHDIIDNELTWNPKDVILEKTFSLFRFNKQTTRKENYREVMLRLAGEAIPILQSKLTQK